VDVLLWPLFLVVGLLTIAGLVLWIWALVDCVQVPDDSMYQSGNKLIWVLIIVFTNWIGAILYLLIGRPKRVEGDPAGSPTSSAPRPDGSGMPPPPGSP
jgi:hypothetical protein